MFGANELKFRIEISAQTKIQANISIDKDSKKPNLKNF